MTFGKLQWMFPIAVTLHNAEEAIWMPRWDLRHAAQLPAHPPGALEIRVVLVVITLVAFGVAYLSVQRGPESIWAYLTFGYFVTMLANVFVPHVPAAILFGGYAPGIVTAVLINLPLMTILAVGAVRERWVSGWKAVAFGAMVPVIALGAIVGWLVAHH